MEQYPERFINQGIIRRRCANLSPSMIYRSPQFERYLFYLIKQDAAGFLPPLPSSSRGKISFSQQELQQVRQDFRSASVDRQATLETIRQFKHDTGYLLDPHTAVGVRAAQELVTDDTPVVCLATAHPAKFGEAVVEATGDAVPVPPAIAQLEGLPTRCVRMQADAGQVRAFIILTVG